MTPATQEQIEAACMTRTAKQAVRHLADQGIFASDWECVQVVKHLIECGERPRCLGVRPTPPAETAASLCRAYLRRLLEADQHCISDPVQMASALREAGMVRA